MFIKMDESFALTAPIPPTPAAELTSLSKFACHSPQTLTIGQWECDVTPANQSERRHRSANQNERRHRDVTADSQWERR